MGQPTRSIDNDRFRSVLGSYPTGVTVVTGLDTTGSVIGMVVGTFTSVSLDPPLVAFLPMKTSRSFQAMRDASSRFCINILAADQEQICRTLAAPGDHKFDNVAWHLSPNGNPIIDGVVAWIDCEYSQVLDGGDHFIVLGNVIAMDLERDTTPLLFFQRGYGRFSTGAMLLANDRDTLAYVRMAEAARKDIEALAHELQLECSLIAPVGNDTVYVAVAHHASDYSHNYRLGIRAPMTPPLATLFVGEPNAPSEDVWLSRLGKASKESYDSARAKLALVRDRQWSISLLGDLTQDELEEAIGLYSNQDRTPAQERHFLSRVAIMFDLHEPEHIESAAHYDVLHLSVPIRKKASAEVLLVLRLGEFPKQLSGEAICSIRKRLQQAAHHIENIIAALPENALVTAQHMSSLNTPYARAPADGTS